MVSPSIESNIPRITSESVISCVEYAYVTLHWPVLYEVAA